MEKSVLLVEDDVDLHSTLADILDSAGYQVISVFNGADALERLREGARSNVILGLLTGNLEQGARAKLEAVGLEPARFRVGAFGSDHEQRPELPAIARERTRRQLGVDVSGDSMVVIGDTPADLTCGLSIGASAIGVATGRYSVQQLMQHNPLAVFSDLSDTRAITRAIIGA